MNKTDRHDIAELMLKAALNTITLTLTSSNLLHMTRFWRKPHQVRQKSKDCKAETLTTVGIIMI